MMIPQEGAKVTVTTTSAENHRTKKEIQWNNHLQIGDLKKMQLPELSKNFFSPL
jgi:hypothetical protein